MTLTDLVAAEEDPLTTALSALDDAARLLGIDAGIHNRLRRPQAKSLRAERAETPEHLRRLGRFLGLLHKLVEGGKVRLG